jgi:integrase
MFRRGQTWWARYSQDGQDVRRSLRTQNRKVAQEVLLDLELELRRGSQRVLEPPSATPAAPKPPSVSIADFKREFTEYSKSSKRPKSHSTDMGRLKEFIASLDVVDLADVTTGHATRFLAAKTNEDKVSPTTILRYRETLHAFFAYARRLSYVRENPISAVPRPRIPDRDPRFLTLEEIDQLLTAVKGDLIAPLIATLVNEHVGLQVRVPCHEICGCAHEGDVKTVG